MIISFPSVSTLSHTYAHIHSLSITRCPIQKFFSDPIALSIIKSNNHRAMIHTCITGRYASHMMPTLSMIGRTSTCSIGPSIYSLRIERICFLLCRAHHYECIGANSLSLSLSVCVCSYIARRGTLLLIALIVSSVSMLITSMNHSRAGLPSRYCSALSRLRILSCMPSQRGHVDVTYKRSPTMDETDDEDGVLDACGVSTL